MSDKKHIERIARHAAREEGFSIQPHITVIQMEIETFYRVIGHAISRHEKTNPAIMPPTQKARDEQQA